MGTSNLTPTNVNYYKRGIMKYILLGKRDFSGIRNKTISSIFNEAIRVMCGCSVEEINLEKTTKFYYYVKKKLGQASGQASTKNVVPSELLPKTCKLVKAVKTRYAKSATKTREAKILSNFNLLLLFLLFLFYQSFFFYFSALNTFLYQSQQSQRQISRFPLFHCIKGNGGNLVPKSNVNNLYLNFPFHAFLA